MALQRRSRVDLAQRARERGSLAAVAAARRQELGLTQIELAELAGVSARFVHNLEAGHAEVGLERLLAVLQTLGLHLLVERGALPAVAASATLAVQYGLDGPTQAGPR
jgi:HTH-type transcriptional regulator/antitoxin HipB